MKFTALVIATFLLEAQAGQRIGQGDFVSTVLRLIFKDYPRPLTSLHSLSHVSVTICRKTR
jgi:hypothetical protein